MPTSVLLVANDLSVRETLTNKLERLHYAVVPVATAEDVYGTFDGILSTCWFSVWPLALGTSFE